MYCVCVCVHSKVVLSAEGDDKVDNKSSSGFYKCSEFM